MTYVDERIVELRFDNKQFEQETAKSMSTLDKLKEKLSFKNASSGAEQLQKSISTINVNPLIQDIDTVETKMSALSIAGKRIIENLVDWGMTGVRKIVNTFETPINQIIQGGKTRAQNIEQAKFQLEGLGVAWSDIEEDISYGVQDTAYGLDAAAKVASQLVASQVELGDEMKHALLGISGVAAMTNSSYDDIGRIYTTVAGNGRLMGEQLLQLSSRGINAAATLGKALNKTEAEIRDMVSKGQISFQMFSDAMFTSFGEHAKSANKTFQGALSNTKAALSRLGADVAAQGFNSIRDILNDIIPKLKEFKKQMKPAEDAIIKMVDAVGKLVQSIIKAIDIEGIVNRISPVIQTAANAIADFAEAYERLFAKDHNMDSSFDPQVEQAEELTETIDDVTEAMKRLYEITDEEKRMANDIWQWGTYGNGEERVRNLGDHYNMVQAYVNKMIELGWDEAKMNEFLAEQIKAHEDALANAEAAEKEKTRAQNIAKIIYNLRRVLVNLGKSIVNGVTVAFSGFGKALGDGKGGITGILAGLSDVLADASDRLMITKSRAAKITPIFKGIGTVVKYIGKGLSLAFDILKKVIKAVVDFVAKAKENEKVVKFFDNVKNAISKLWDALKKVYERIRNSEAWDKFLNILKTVGEFLLDKLGKAFSFIADISDDVANGAVVVFEKLSEKLKEIKENAENGNSWLGKIKDFFKDDILSGSWLEKLKQLLEDIFGSSKNVFKTAFDKGSDFINGLISGLKNVSIDDMTRAAKIVLVLASIFSTARWLWSLGNVNFAMQNVLGGLDEILESLSITINKWGKRADAQRFQMFAISIAIIVGSLIALMGAIAALQIFSQMFNLDPKFIVNTAGQILIIITLIAGVVAVLIAKFSKEKYWNNQSKSINVLSKVTIPWLAATLLAVGYAIQSVIRSLLTVYKIINDKQFSVGAFSASILIVISTFVLLGALVGAILVLSKKTEKISGVATILFSMTFLISSVVKAYVKLAEVVEYLTWYDAAFTAGILITLLTGVLGMCLAIIVVSSKFPSAGVNNPFKGIFSTMLGLTILLRLAVIPLIGALTAAYKEGKAGERAIYMFTGILALILGFIVVLTAGMRILDNFSKRAGGGTGPFLGVAAIVGALALLFWSLTSAFNSLKGLDNKKLIIFGALVAGILLIVGALAALVTVVSMAAGPVVLGALLGLAAVIASVGIAFLGAGYGFKAFEEGLVHLINSLPGMVDSLLAFFSKVEANADAIRSGIFNTVSLMIEGAILAVVAGLYSLRESVPMLVKALVLTVTDAINGLADTIFENGKDLVDAVLHLEDAFVYIIGYAALKSGERGAELFKKMFWGVVDQNLRELPGTRTVGKADWYTESENELNSLKKKYGEQGAKEATMASGEWRENWEKTMRAIAGSEKTDFLQLDSYLEFDELDSGSSLSDFAKKFTNYMDISKYTGQLGELLEDGSGALSSWQNMDVEGILGNLEDGGYDSWANMGFSWGDGTLEGYQKAVEEGGAEAGEEYLKMFTNIDELAEAQSEQMANLGVENMDEYIKSVEEKKDPTVQAFKDILDECTNTIVSYEVEFYKAGLMLHEGFNMGVSDEDLSKMTINNVADLVRQSKMALVREALIKSPSKVFMELGQYVTMGFANGISDLAYMSADATKDVGEIAINSLKSILDRMYSNTIDGMDTNPTITPVLDLSQLEEGIGSMNGMLDNNSSFGLAFGNATSYNNGLSAKFAGMKVQNEYDGTNVVEAVNSLRTDINEIKAEITTLGFYVDGKQMATAIADPMSSALNKIAVNTGRGV